MCHIIALLNPPSVIWESLWDLLGLRCLTSLPTPSASHNWPLISHINQLPRHGANSQILKGLVSVQCFWRGNFCFIKPWHRVVLSLTSLEKVYLVFCSTCGRFNFISFQSMEVLFVLLGFRYRFGSTVVHLRWFSVCMKLWLEAGMTWLGKI